MPTEVMVPVPHVAQKYSWDCGLACSLMVLTFLKRNTSGFSELCKKLEFGESVWTIDLANIMKHYNIRHHLFTITMGVDKGYSKQNFYKDKFTADEMRVNKLFAEKQELGLLADERSVTLQEIISHLSQGNVAIVLVDWSILCRSFCVDTAKCLPLSCVGKCPSVYQGHFVVVCGYSQKNKEIYIQNPASHSSDVISASFQTFEAARKSYGTDEDLLFIYKD